jgi:hypothetical protein
MTLQAAQATAVSSQPALVYKHFWEDPMSCNENIGPAEPGYKRSLALLHQIHIINSNEGIDYYLIPGNPSTEPRGAVFQDLAVKIFFREARAKAMTSGDRDAVAAIGQLLVRQPGGISRGEILAQLKSEYGFDVEVAVAELDRWSAREAGGLSKVEFKSRDFMSTSRELFSNPELAETRVEVVKNLADILRGERPL